MIKCALEEQFKGVNANKSDKHKKSNFVDYINEPSKKSSASSIEAAKCISKIKSSKLSVPISDDRQIEIDSLIDEAAEKRQNINPLDPRVARIIRPSIWLWQ